MINSFVKQLDKRTGYLLSAGYSYAAYVHARHRFDRYMKRKMGDFMVPVAPGPIGDEEIIKRTAILKEEDIGRIVNPYRYFASGYSNMLAWLQLAERHSFNLRTAKTIMELGCGSARLIRHLRCIDGVRLVGTDVRSEFIKWCKANLPDIEFYINDVDPPLAFAEQDSFDLVFAQSVFTHIPLGVQSRWIEEMYRVLCPGGFLILNVLGRNHQLQMLDSEDRAKLKDYGHLTLDSTSAKASLSTRLIRSWDVFQTRSEVLKAFGSVFHVHDYVPESLDILVLQKAL